MNSNEGARQRYLSLATAIRIEAIRLETRARAGAGRTRAGAGRKEIDAYRVRQIAALLVAAQTFDNLAAEREQTG
jgi:hypothetical protein